MAAPIAKITKLVISVYWALFLKNNPQQNTKFAKLNSPKYIKTCIDSYLTLFTVDILDFITAMSV